MDEQKESVSVQHDMYDDLYGVKDDVEDDVEDDHLVNERLLSKEQGIFTTALCGRDVSTRESLVTVNWRQRPRCTLHQSTYCAFCLCRACVKTCRREWIREQRKLKKLNPASLSHCRQILLSIRSDVRSDDLEEMAKYAEELRVTARRMLKEDVPRILYKEQGERCALCNERQRNRKNMALDHIIPRAKGGKTSFRNLQLACRACNEEKGSGDNEEYKNKLRREGRIVDDSDE